MTPYEIVGLAGVVFMLTLLCMIIILMWYDIYRQQVYASRVVSSQEWTV